MSRESARTSGQVLSVFTNDVPLFGHVFQSPVYLVIVPVQLITGVVVLIDSLGTAAVAGVVWLFICIPLQGWLMRISKRSK